MTVTGGRIQDLLQPLRMHLGWADAHYGRASFQCPPTRSGRSSAAQSSPFSSCSSSIAARRLRPTEPEASITIVAIRSQMPIRAV